MTPRAARPPPPAAARMLVGGLAPGAGWAPVTAGGSGVWQDCKRWPPLPRPAGPARVRLRLQRHPPPAGATHGTPAAVLRGRASRPDGVGGCGGPSRGPPPEPPVATPPLLRRWPAAAACAHCRHCGSPPAVRAAGAGELGPDGRRVRAHPAAHGASAAADPRTAAAAGAPGSHPARCGRDGRYARCGAAAAVPCAAWQGGEAGSQGGGRRDLCIFRATPARLARPPRHHPCVTPPTAAPSRWPAPVCTCWGARSANIVRGGHRGGEFSVWQALEPRFNRVKFPGVSGARRTPLPLGCSCTRGRPLFMKSC